MEGEEEDILKPGVDATDPVVQARLILKAWKEVKAVGLSMETEATIYASLRVCSIIQKLPVKWEEEAANDH